MRVRGKRSERKSDLNSLWQSVRLTRVVIMIVMMKIVKMIVMRIVRMMVVKLREKRPQLFVALGKIDQPCASHSQAV